MKHTRRLDLSGPKRRVAQPGGVHPPMRFVRPIVVKHYLSMSRYSGKLGSQLPGISPLSHVPCLFIILAFLSCLVCLIMCSYSSQLSFLALSASLCVVTAHSFFFLALSASLCVVMYYSQLSFSCLVCLIMSSYHSQLSFSCLVCLIMCSYSSQLSFSCLVCLIMCSYSSQLSFSWSYSSQLSLSCLVCLIMCS